MNIHKYDHTKGSKAFSYFSIVAKNYLILHNNNNYKRYKTHDKLDVVKKNYDYNESDDMNNFIEVLVVYFDLNIPKLFKRKKDISIAYSILELIEKREGIENFNKKAIYILIREMTNVETSHITKVANVLRKHYKKIMKEYQTVGHITVDVKNNKFF